MHHTHLFHLIVSDSNLRHENGLHIDAYKRSLVCIAGTSQYHPTRHSMLYHVVVWNQTEIFAHKTMAIFKFRHSLYGEPDISVYL